MGNKQLGDLVDLCFDFMPFSISTIQGMRSSFSHNDQIIHSRYILSNTSYEEMKTIFDYFEIGSFESIPVIWIASLLKDERFLHHITDNISDLIVKSSIAYLLSCLMVYETDRATNHLIKIAKSHSDQSPLAIYCLQELDKKFNTYHSREFTVKKIHKKSERLFQTMIIYSTVLRGGIQYSNPKEFKRKMTVLLNETTPPSKFHLLSLKKISSLSEFKTFCLQQIENQNIKTQKNQPREANRSLSFKNEVQRYLMKTPDAYPNHNLQSALEKTFSYLDILAGIEMDLDHLLPIEIIDLCFEKLLQLINGSYQLYEQYALHLLLRGSSMDSNAQNMYSKSQFIKNKYKINEEKCYQIGDCGYVMLKD